MMMWWLILLAAPLLLLFFAPKVAARNNNNGYDYQRTTVTLLHRVLSHIKLLGLDARAGLILCSGPDLRIRYMDPALDPYFGEDSLTSLHELVPASKREAHRALLARLPKGQPLPDSLNYPLRRMHLVSPMTGNVLHATLAIGRLDTSPPEDPDFFYVVVQPMTSDAAHRHRPSTDACRACLGETAASYFNAETGLTPQPELYARATVLYVDIVNFSRQCTMRRLDQLGDWMQSIHGVVDALLDRHCVRKVETRGDCVICITGTNYAFPHDPVCGERLDLAADQATRMLAFAAELGRRLSSLHRDDDDDAPPTHVRVGVATGPVVLTFILHAGDLLPAKYIFGNTVNLAARMEQSGRVGHVHVAESTFTQYHQTERGLAPDDVPLLLGVSDIKSMGLTRSALFDYRADRWVAPFAHAPLAHSATCAAL